MFVNKKAHYNLLQSSSPQKKGWPFRDYRTLDDAALFHDLAQEGLHLDSIETFIKIASEHDAPEDLASELLKDFPEPDHAFLILFELWRRFLPDSRSVSLFCDELDYQIHKYYAGKNKKQIAEEVDYLQQICDENADSGIPQTDILVHLQNSCCQDIEAFLYDYILEQIESHYHDYAQDLIEGFYPYIQHQSWFEYLMIRLKKIQEPAVGDKSLKKLIKHVNDIDLALEILYFLSDTRDPLFIPLAKKTLELVETYADLKDLIAYADYYFDQEAFSKAISPLKKKDLHKPIDLEDKSLIKLRKFFSAQN
jgi:hypothetical protein